MTAKTRIETVISAIGEDMKSLMAGSGNRTLPYFIPSSSQYVIPDNYIGMIVVSTTIDGFIKSDGLLLVG